MYGIMNGIGKTGPLQLPPFLSGFNDPIVNEILNVFPRSTQTEMNTLTGETTKLKMTHRTQRVLQYQAPYKSIPLLNNFFNIHPEYVATIYTRDTSKRP